MPGSPAISNHSIPPKLILRQRKSIDHSYPKSNNHLWYAGWLAVLRYFKIVKDMGNPWVFFYPILTHIRLYPYPWHMGMGTHGFPLGYGFGYPNPGYGYGFTFINYNILHRIKIKILYLKILALIRKKNIPNIGRQIHGSGYGYDG